MNSESTIDLSRAMSQFSTAMYDMREIYNHSQRDGYTVDESAYQEAQKTAKIALYELMIAANDMVEETDVYETEDGSTIDLPLPPLSRGVDFLPEDPQA